RAAGHLWRTGAASNRPGAEDPLAAAVPVALGSARAQRRRGSHDRVDDRRIARTAAQMSGELGADLRLGRVGVLLEEEPGGHQNPRRTEAALEAELLVE